MPDIIKVGMLGGDRRSLVTACCLAEKYECAVWGFSSVYKSSDSEYLKNTVRCADPMSAVHSSMAVILPLPASSDGVRLNCPLADIKNDPPDIRLTAICEQIPHGALLLGGLIPPFVKKFAVERGLSVIDYYDSEELQIKNAVPTAEGAIAACISSLPVTIAGMRTIVFGYGRVGRTLAQRLKYLGADVFVAARSIRDLSNAACDGCTPVTISEYREKPIRTAAVFNTIPHMIFDRELLEKLSADTVIFELASGNSGVDIAAAEELSVKVHPLPSLPGKTAPFTAGEIICSVVSGLLDEHFGRSAND